MKALLSETTGGPETLVVAEIAEPTPGPGEVRIRVHACGVNYPDALMIEDKYQFRPPRPFAPGGEVAGEIDVVGENVTRWKIGDRVIALVGCGGMAEKVIAPETKCVAMAPEMPYDEGAAFIFTYGTSYHALKQRASLRAGETLLVLGAAGGVGLAAVELGSALGAQVIAAVSTEEKLALAKRHGAAAGVVYATGEFDKTGARTLADQFKQATAPHGADVIYDAVGGAYAEAALRAIAWQGCFLVVGFPAGIPRIPLNLALLKGCQIVGVFWGSFAERDAATNERNNTELLDLYTEGKIRPHISARYSLADAAAAIRALSERRALGKLVVELG